MTFQFASPIFLGLLLLIPLLLIYRRRIKPASLRYASIQLLGTTAHSWRVRGQRLLPLLRLLALALVIVALARPQFVEARDVVNGQGIDITLALDISGSMASLDFQPDNRLETAKNVISSFIEERPYDRIGLIVFASEAFNQSPLTVDHDVLHRLLERVKLATDLKLDDGTAIGLGLANAANMLQNSEAKSRVVILLTDGVNNSGQIDPMTAAQAAATLGIKVYTIGMGKPGQVPVPVTDMFGQETVVYQQSTIDEETLRQIADQTGGLYFRAEDTDGLRAIYDQINTLEKTQVEITVYTRAQEMAIFVLFPAVSLMLVEMLLRHTLFRRIP